MPGKLLMLLPLLVIAPVLGAPVAMGAELEAVSGSVQARDMREDGAWTTAGSGRVLAAGSAVRTGSESRAIAALPDALLALGAGSNLDLVRLDGMTQLILARGTLALVVEQAPGEALQVATPRGVAEIHQAGRYLIEAGDLARPTRLSVFDGAARLVTGDGALATTSGQVAWIALDNITRLGATGSAMADWPARPVPAAPMPVEIAAVTPAPAVPMAVLAAAVEAAPRDAVVGTTATTRSAARVAIPPQRSQPAARTTRPQSRPATPTRSASTPQRTTPATTIPRQRPAATTRQSSQATPERPS